MVCHPVKYQIMPVGDYRAYRPSGTPQKYGKLGLKNIAKTRKELIAQMKPHTLDSFYPLMILRAMKNLKLVYDMNGTHEGAAI